MELKICVECRHHYHLSDVEKPMPGVPSGHRCVHPSVTRLNLVTGEKVYPLCMDTRNVDTRCGIDGLLFEPKVPVFRPILKASKDG